MKMLAVNIILSTITIITFLFVFSPFKEYPQKNFPFFFLPSPGIVLTT